MVCGYRRHPPGWLPDAEALGLLAQANLDANLPLAEKRELVRAALAQIGEWGGHNPIQRGI